MMTRAELTRIRRRVAAGLAWLKANHPDYRDKIDVPSLDMKNCWYCILGQVVGDFWNVVKLTLGDHKPMTQDTAVSLGFQCPPRIRNSGDGFLYYEALAKEWKRVLSEPANG